MWIAKKKKKRKRKRPPNKKELNLVWPRILRKPSLPHQPTIPNTILIFPPS